MYIPASSELHANQADEAYMRVGDKSRKLSFEERIQLMYDKGERYYEDTAVYGATADDIDMAAVERYTGLIGYFCCPVKLLLNSKIRADTSHEVSALLVIFVFRLKKIITMSKDSHFRPICLFFDVAFTI